MNYIAKISVACIGLVLSFTVYSCDEGTAGISVQGDSEESYWVNVYAGKSGQYNQTEKVDANQSQEFCWNVDYGPATVTKTDTEESCWKYNWPIPDIDNGEYYKTIYISSGNWTSGCK